MAALVGLDPRWYITASTVEERVILEAVLAQAVTYQEQLVRAQAQLTASYIAQVLPRLFA